VQAPAPAATATVTTVQPECGDDDDEGWGDWDAAGSTQQQHEVETQQAEQLQKRLTHFEHELKKYQHDLVDPVVRGALNAALAAHELPALLEYYESRPELGEYTITQELPRMDYRVIPADGDAGEITDKGAIRAAHESTKESVVWRLANQSLFSDTLVELHARLLRPDLSIAITNETSRFTVDLREATKGVEAVSSFKISTLGEGCEMLMLGVIEGRVAVDLAAGRLQMSFAPPRLAVVLQDKWHGAARMMSENDAFLMEDPSQPHSHDDGGDRATRGWNNTGGLVTELRGQVGLLAEDGIQGVR